MWRSIKTDLAMEARELAQEQSRHEIPGVRVDNVEPAEDIRISRVEVFSEEGREIIGKPIGNYITLEVPGIRDRDPEYEEQVKQHLANEIRRLVHLRDDSVILIVGLGNWNITRMQWSQGSGQGLVTRHILICAGSGGRPCAGSAPLPRVAGHYGMSR